MQRSGGSWFKASPSKWFKKTLSEKNPSQKKGWWSGSTSVLLEKKKKKMGLSNKSDKSAGAHCPTSEDIKRTFTFVCDGTCERYPGDRAEATVGRCVTREG
jgi:hypothetical protein